MSTILVVSLPCPRCQQTKTVEMTNEQLVELHTRRKNIQDILPEHPAGVRERFQTGYCPACWDILFKEED